MNLEFLTPAGAVAESPMAGATQAAGGSLAERDGWLVAVSYADAATESRALSETVGWADVSHVRKTERRGRHRLALGSAERMSRTWTCPITSDRVLVLNGDETDGLDITCQMGALVLGGPRARDVVARFCALDLRPRVSPPGTFLPGSVARTPGYVLVLNHDRLLLLFGAAYGLYVWDVVADAGAHLGGGPVGLDALQWENRVDA